MTARSLLPGWGWGAVAPQYSVCPSSRAGTPNPGPHLAVGFLSSQAASALPLFRPLCLAAAPIASVPSLAQLNLVIPSPRSLHLAMAADCPTAASIVTGLGVPREGSSQTLGPAIGTHHI